MNSSHAVAAAVARTFLFVPGDRPERFARAAGSGADLVVLDLEDAVAPEDKESARVQVTAWLGEAGAAAAVRVNAIATPWHDDDLQGVAETGAAVVMVPKSEDPTALEGVLAVLPAGSSIVALIETSQGVINAPSIAKVPGVQRLALGTFDLAAELGVDPDHAPAMAGARQALVLASAAAGLPGPVDGVTGDVRDLDRLVADVEAAAGIGFAGKLCIHPGQVPPAEAALAPSAEDVAWATRVLAAADATERGVVVVDGRMVDAPVITRAERIVASVR